MRSIFMIILIMIAALSFPIGQMTLKGTVLSQIPVDGSEPGNEDPSWDGGWTNIVPANHTGQTFTSRRISSQRSGGCTST